MHTGRQQCGSHMGRIQDLWRGGGAAAVPFEDPLWNFKRGRRRGRAPPLALLEDPLWNFKRGARPLRPPVHDVGQVGGARVGRVSGIRWRLEGYRTDRKERLPHQRAVLLTQ